MTLSTRILLLVFSLVLVIATTALLKKEKIHMKYSIIWYFSSIIVFILAVFPVVIGMIAKIFGFQTFSNLISAIMIGLLLFITMALSITVATLNKKVITMIQEISILKEELYRKNEKR